MPANRFANPAHGVCGEVVPYFGDALSTVLADPPGRLVVVAIPFIEPGTGHGKLMNGSFARTQIPCHTRRPCVGWSGFQRTCSLGPLRFGCISVSDASETGPAAEKKQQNSSPAWRFRPVVRTPWGGTAPVTRPDSQAEESQRSRTPFFTRKSCIRSAHDGIMALGEKPRLSAPHLSTSCWY